MINYKGKGISLRGIYKLRYERIKKIIDNKMFRICRQIPVLLNEKDESEIYYTNLLFVFTLKHI